MRLRKRIMAIFLTTILLLTNTLPVAAAGDAVETLPVSNPTATLTVEKVGEGTVHCTGDGVTEMGACSYSIVSGSSVTVDAQPTNGFTFKQASLNGSDVKGSFVMPENNSTLKVVFEELPKEEQASEKPEEPLTLTEPKPEEQATEKPPVESEKAKPEESKKENSTEKTGEATKEQVSEEAKSDEPKPEELEEQKLEELKLEEEKPSEEEYLVNSKGIKVKKSLLCENPNCLEEHVGTTLDPSSLPIKEVTGAKMFSARAMDERILSDVYVGMVVTGQDCIVRFRGRPGHRGYFDIKVQDGGLAGVVSTGLCINHGAANPGEYGWVTCIYEAVCTKVEGDMAEWSFTITPPDAWDGETYFEGRPDGYQRVGMNVRVRFEQTNGNLNLYKSSAKPEITDGNSNYSLEGAVYGLYQNDIEIAQATTDVNGYAAFSEIRSGDYVLKEITAPKGYALDLNTYNVTITSGTTIDQYVTDIPLTDPVVLLLGKVDRETNLNKPQGTASLEGAEFTVKYYNTQSATDPALDGLSPVRSWILKTDKDGYTRLDEKFKVSGDAFYLQDGVATLPLGTITIQETKAPNGYLLNPEMFIRQITLNGAGNGILTYNMPVVPETAQKGIIQLQKKCNESNLGNASLKGAEYEVRNTDGTVVDTLVTDAKGKAQSKELPLGTYTVKETKAPGQFLLDSKTHTVEFVASNKTDRVFYQTVESIETLQKGIIQLQKKCNEPDMGNAVLKGAEYEVRNEKGILVETLVTDVNGKAQSKELPFGTYTVKETKAPTYFLRDRETHKVVLSATNTTDRVHYFTVESIETLQKGMIELQKVDSETKKNEAQGSASLEGAVYDIFLKSAYQPGDGVGSKSYRETITTDKTGLAKSKELLLDTYYVMERIPSNGYLVDPKIYEVKLDPKNTTDRVFTEKVTSKETIIRGNVEIIKLRENVDNELDTLQGLEGVEFTFTSDTTGEVVKKIVTDKNGFASTVEKDHPRGGLVFDTYTVTETKCPEGLKPIEPFKVTIKDEGVTLKGIYKEDKIIVSPVSVVKVDATTGKVIPVANTEFRLLDANKKPVTMVTHYPNKVEHTIFKTNKNGQFTFPDKLAYGTYYLEELKAPQGYLKGQLLEFKVTNGANWENPLVVKYADENAMGKITIQKTDKENGDFITGAVFDIKAAENIVTPDGTIRVKKGEVVDTLITSKGVATSKALFLGKYKVVEVKAAPGYEAMHILAPQVENLFRNIAKEVGGLTITLEIDGVSKEKVLKSIFDLPELLDCYDNDILFLFKGLLNEQAGANIRNEIAHGITSEYMASSGAYLYFAGAVIKLLTYTSIKCYDLITTEGSKLKTFVEPGSDAIKIKRM